MFIFADSRNEISLQMFHNVNLNRYKVLFCNESKRAIIGKLLWSTRNRTPWDMLIVEKNQR